jgi:elongation factor P
MLSMNELKMGISVSINKQPYEIIKAEHHKMGRGGAVLKLKLRNLIDASVLEKTVQGNETMEAADLDLRKVQYLYNDGKSYSFMEQDTYETITLDANQIGEKKDYLKESLELEAMYYNGNPVAIELPIKMKFRVIESPPGIKGDTAQGGSKQIKIETGLTVNAPLFIKEGEEIVVDTRDGSYVERA